MKTIYIFFLMTFIVGCASNGSDDRYLDYGHVKGERVRILPCNPFYADELMDWASELDTKSTHERSARAVVDADGRVRCSSKESAGSSYNR